MKWQKQDCGKWPPFWRSGPFIIQKHCGENPHYTLTFSRSFTFKEAKAVCKCLVDNFPEIVKEK